MLVNLHHDTADLNVFIGFKHYTVLKGSFIAGNKGFEEITSVLGAKVLFLIEECE